ncbi:hypothetical protein MMC30_007759 [Trapelia coarctata]|nr:hypothetical protein [Trapelia coarctata]
MLTPSDLAKYKALLEMSVFANPKSRLRPSFLHQEERVRMSYKDFLELDKIVDTDPISGNILSSIEVEVTSIDLGGEHEPAELDIRLCALYPISHSDGGDVKYPLTWRQLRSDLEGARYDVAIDRCRKVLLELAEREANINNSDVPQ